MPFGTLVGLRDALQRIPKGMISPPRATPAASGGNVTFLRSGHQVDTQLPTVDSASSESEVADLFTACSPWDLKSTTADDRLLKTIVLTVPPALRPSLSQLTKAFTAITSGLKSGKSIDHLGIASEHFLHAARELAPPLQRFSPPCLRFPISPSSCATALLPRL